MSRDVAWAPGLSPLSRRQRTVKRAVDLGVGVPALIFASPIIAVSTLAARLDTGQSGIFTQKRVGLHGRPFVLYKVRTMRAAGQSSVTTSNDPRVTPLGRLFRRFKIDELPQLVNVVRGDMSLVGPRPDVAGFADLLTGNERIILDILPGLTGPATLYFRDEERLLSSVADPETYNRETIYPMKVQLNVVYALNYSLSADIRYVFGTISRLVPLRWAGPARPPAVNDSDRNPKVGAAE